MVVTSNFSDSDPNALIVLSAIISLAITENNDVDELVSIGNFLTAIANLILHKAGQLAHQEEIKTGTSKFLF